LTASRKTAVVIACLVVAIASAACGVGPGKDLGAVDLIITRDYGAPGTSSEFVTGARESDTVLRLLDRSAEITTRYGGAFVQSIDGVEGRSSGGRPFDWFFYVDGVESEVGAADFPVKEGDRVWWDYRDWGSAMRVPAVVGSWPEPFVHGYADHDDPTVSIRCQSATHAACGDVRASLRDAGARIGGSDGDIRVLVGTWGSLRADPAARAIEAGPESSGVFATFDATPGGYSLEALDEAGAPAEGLGPAAGLIAATRRFDGPPTWLVTGATRSAVRAAARHLDEGDLRNHYAVAVTGDGVLALPAR